MYDSVRPIGSKTAAVTKIAATSLKIEELSPKMSHKEMKAINHRLLQEKAKYEALFESLELGVFVIDTNTRIVIANKKVENILGVDSEGMKGKYLYEIFRLMDEHGQILSDKKKFVSTVLKTGKSGHGIYYVLGKRGKKVPISLTVSPMVINQKIVGLSIVFRDITTDLKNDLSKREFVAIASHQFRTPLAIFNWYQERLLSGELGPLNSMQKKYLLNTSRTVKNMLDLVNNFLNTSKIELGIFALKPIPIDAVHVAKTVIDEYHDSIQGKKLHLIKTYSNRPLIVNLDLNLLKIILQNLLSNAIKYTPDHGTIKLDIRLQSQGSKKNLEIKISDTGIGIPDTQKTEIFQKFFRADNARSVDPGGIGLGLYAIKSLLRNAEGKIWFESLISQKKGEIPYHICFHIQIPLKKKNYANTRYYPQ